MKNSTKMGIVVCLAILLAFSLSLAFAGNEKTNVTKNMTNVTKNMTNVTKNMTNATNPYPIRDKAMWLYLLREQGIKSPKANLEGKKN